jgi:hypothetical protein
VLLPLRAPRREEARRGHVVGQEGPGLAVPGRGGGLGRGGRRAWGRRGRAGGGSPAAAEPGVAEAGEGAGAEEAEVVARRGGGRRSGLAGGCHVGPGGGFGG